MSRGVRFTSRQECDTCGEDIVFEVHDDAFGTRYVTVTHGRPGEKRHTHRSDPIMTGGMDRDERLTAAMTLTTHAVLQRTECLEYHYLVNAPGWSAVSPF